MFVLGLTMMLLAISGSIMAAASASVGANVSQTQYNRALVLTESIHRIIQHSLVDIEQFSTPPDHFNFSLKKHIAEAIYNTDPVLSKADGYPNPNPPAVSSNPQFKIDFDKIDLDVDFINPNTDIGDVTVYLRFPFKNVNKTGPVGKITHDTLTILRIPSEANIIATMEVTVIVKVQDNNRAVMTRATYELIDAYLSDKSDEENMSDIESGDSNYIGLMKWEDYGTWELVNYEIIG